MRDYFRFLARCLAQTVVGGPAYFAWLGGLAAVSLGGLHCYAKQLVSGLSVTGMTDAVSWGIYIANFTFLVGMAAAAVMLVIPVYVYKDRELSHVVIFGELLAVAAIIMCLLLVTVDLGRPDRFWHLIPGLGRFNWPISMLTWDVIVLNVYLLLNVYICGYLIYSVYRDRRPARSFYIPFVMVAMVWAISIHTVTAFLYVGLGGRPFWNSAIVAPRFLASAFASGPAFLILTLQLVRATTGYRVADSALMRLRSFIQVAMLINVFLLGCEVFTEFYAGTTHVVSSRYLYLGLHGHHALVPWIWSALACQLVGLALLMLPQSHSVRYLNPACALAFCGIWMEKGMGLIVPGFVPTPLGEIREYTPTMDEWMISWGIWAFGFLLYTLMLKMTIPVLTGRLRAPERTHP